MSTPEQRARDMLERAGIEEAQSMTSGDLVEIANLIADSKELKKKEIVLSDKEQERFADWVKQNVSAHIVPGDEGNDEALIYNLVHLIRGDDEKWNYKYHQYKEVESWGALRLGATGRS